jgi:hypothetical protein
VGVLPQNALVEWIDLPPPAALFERVDLPRKRERCSEPVDKTASIKSHLGLDSAIARSQRLAMTA